MKQEAVFVKLKFKIEYDNKKCKLYLLERLVSNPCVSMAGVWHLWKMRPAMGNCKRAHNNVPPKCV